MSDKGEINKEGTTPEEIYNYRLKYKSNEGPYYYIKKYESDMKWYKIFIIIIVIAFIFLIVLIIMGVIKIDALPWVLAISFLLSGYCIYWYRNYKEDRDRSIQDAKVKIGKELNDKELNDKEEKNKQVENKKQLEILKQKEEDKKKNVIDNLKEIKAIILNNNPNYILDTKRDNNPRSDKIYTVINRSMNSYPDISDNIKNNLNTIMYDSFDGNYYSALNTAVQDDNEISKDIKDYIRNITSNLNTMSRYEE